MDLVRRLLVLDPSVRLGAKSFGELRAHPFFRGVDWESLLEVTPPFVPQLGGDDGGPKYDKKIGMYVMRTNEIYRRKVLFDSDEMEGEEVVDSTP